MDKVQGRVLHSDDFLEHLKIYKGNHRYVKKNNDLIYFFSEIEHDEDIGIVLLNDILVDDIGYLVKKVEDL